MGVGGMKQSNSPTDEETCRRKRSYTNKKAKHVLKLLRTNEKGVHGSIYKCSVCSTWHITSWPKTLYTKIIKEKARHGKNDS